MPQTDLNESAQVTLDGSGNGFVTLGPSYTYQTWYPTMVNVLITPPPAVEPTFKLYRGSAGPSSYIGGTYTGSNDSSDLNGVTLNPGEKLFGVWSLGGTPGGVASMTITGKISTP
jgi:hypothetical protein